MRSIFLVLLCCAPLMAEPVSNFGRVWNPAVAPGPKLEFTIDYGLSGGAHGRGHEALFDAMSAFEAFEDKIDEALNFSFQGPTPPFSLIVDAIKLLHKLDGLKTYPSSGLLSEYQSEWRAVMRNNFIKGDAITVSATSAMIGSLQSTIDLSSLFGRRILDDWGDDWLQDIDPMIQALLGRKPTSKGGLAWAQKLREAGYAPDYAEVMAWIAEISNIDFDGISGAVLQDALINSLLGFGESIESGESPLASSESKILRKVAVVQHFGLGYSFPIGSWLTVGVQANYIRASLIENFRYVRDTKTTRGVAWPLITGVGDALSWRLDELRQTASVDAGITLRPPNTWFDKLAFSIQVHNLNQPQLKWHEGKLSFDAQVRLGATWDLFGKELPFLLSLECDANSVRSNVLPNYHQQIFRWEFGIQPEYKTFGLSVKLGSRLNIAEANEPNIFTFELGIHFWAFELKLGGESTASALKIPNLSLPEQFGFYAQARLHFNW